MKDAALVLIKIKEDSDFFSLYNLIHSLPFVTECNATRGDIDLFIKIEESEGNSSLSIFENRIKTLEGIKEASYLPLLREEKGKSEKTSLLHSCILTEIENEKLDDAVKSICKEEFTESCTIIEGRYNLLILIGGEQFIQIDKHVHQRLMNLDGVIKIKEYPVIDIYGN